MRSRILMRLGLASEWAQEAALAALALAVGFGIMPLLIYWAGSSLLGRYEGASPGRIFAAVYRGLDSGSVACWVVVFGPYGLYLIYKALRLWWRAGLPAA